MADVEIDNLVSPRIKQCCTLICLGLFQRSITNLFTCIAGELFGWSQKRGFAPRDEFRNVVAHSTENSQKKKESFDSWN